MQHLFESVSTTRYFRMIIEKNQLTPSGILNDMERNRGKQKSLKGLTEPPRIIQVWIWWLVFLLSARVCFISQIWHSSLSGETAAISVPTDHGRTGDLERAATSVQCVSRILLQVLAGLCECLRWCPWVLLCLNTALAQPCKCTITKLWC